MATLWQPYDLAWKILRCEDIKSILNIRTYTWYKPKTMLTFADGLSLTFSKVVPLVGEYKRVVARHQTKQCLPLHFFPKDWIVGTDLVLDVHFHKNRLPVKVGGFCTFERACMKKTFLNLQPHHDP